MALAYGADFCSLASAPVDAEVQFLTSAQICVEVQFLTSVWSGSLWWVWADFLSRARVVVETVNGAGIAVSAWRDEVGEIVEIVETVKLGEKMRTGENVATDENAATDEDAATH